MTLPSRAAIEAVLPADCARLSGIRRLTSAYARLWGVDDEAVSDAVLIADELFANAVQHGSTGPGDTVTFNIALEAQQLRITVADTAVGEPQRRTPHDDEETGGRGLLLVDALSAKWGVDPDGQGKRTWAVLSLPSPASVFQTEISCPTH